MIMKRKNIWLKITFLVNVLSGWILLSNAFTYVEANNLIQNGSFEDAGSHAWLRNHYEGEIDLFFDPEVSIDGNQSMQVAGTVGGGNAPNGARGGVRQLVDLSSHSSDVYRFRASYRTKNISKPDAVLVRFMFNDATGARISNLHLDPLHRIGSNNVTHSYISNLHLHIEATELAEEEWKEIDVTFIPPSGTDEINVALFLWHDIGTVWWDNVSLERINDGLNTGNGSVEWVTREDALPLPFNDKNAVPRDYIDDALRVAKVDNVSALRRAIADAKPGDVILIEDGTYEGHGPIIIEDKHGTDSAPIVVAAGNIGKARITGSLQFIIKDSSYIVIEGLSFETSVDDNKKKDFARRRTNSAIVLLDAYRSRITRNRFALQETYGSETRREWLSVDGSRGGYNRIDHNLFEGKVQVGNFIAVNADLGRSVGTNTSPRHTRIDHNHFRDMAPLGINGLEAIVLGMASYRDMSNVNAHSVVEYNLFERTDGERAEIISIKDSSNIVRYNTIVESAGAIVTRYGHRASIYGNYIIGNNKARTGGVRIYGIDHKVYNNYFEGLAAFTINLGKGNIEDPHNMPRLREDHEIPEDVQIDGLGVAFNTLVNNALNFTVSDREHSNLEPENVLIANNLIIANSNHAVGWDHSTLLSHSGIEWMGNMAHGSERAFAGVDRFGNDHEPFRMFDPKMTLGIDGVMYIDHDSPAIDSAFGTFPYVTTDIEGKSRDESPDVGAFENVGFPLLYGPLTEEDVGPFSVIERRELSLESNGAFITDIQLTPMDDSTSTPGWSGRICVVIDGVVTGGGTEDFELIVRFVNGEEIYRGSKFPARFDFETINLDEGNHELIITSIKGDQQAIRRVSFAVENVVIGSPGAHERVHGVWPLDLDVRLPVDVIESAQVFVGDQLIFEGSDIPRDIVLDSRSLKEGGHTLRVEIKRKGGGQSVVTRDFRVNNIWEIDDSLKPPVDFFGQLIDQSATIDSSEGWIYATDQPGDFFGDGDRLVNEDGTLQYLIWESPQLSEVDVTIYSQSEKGVGEGLKFSISADGIHYIDIDYDVKLLDASEAGWYKLALVAHPRDNHVVKFFRITLQPYTPTSTGLQIGHVKLTGFN